MKTVIRRRKIPKEEQLEIFRRDGWLCGYCKRPVIFGPVMKFLKGLVAGQNEPLAYYHPRWTRNGSPLLDDLGAVLDHITPFALGGKCVKDNLVTSCPKCNGEKDTIDIDTWKKHRRHKAVMGKYGEPQHWDGLSTVFLMLAKDRKAELTKDEKAWFKALGKTPKLLEVSA